jgi:hypothetical protein
VSFCVKAAQAMIQGDDAKAVEYRARVEAEERELDHSEHPLYSKARGRMVSIPEKVKEMDGEYEDLMFILSDSSNESLRGVKGFSVDEVVRFTRQLNRKFKRQNVRSDQSDTD